MGVLTKITKKYLNQRVILMNTRNNTQYLSRVRIREIAMREALESDNSRIVVMQARGTFPPAGDEDEGIWFRCDYWKVWVPA